MTVIEEPTETTAPVPGPLPATSGIDIPEDVHKQMAESGDQGAKTGIKLTGELATKFRIVSIPTLILFKDGQPAHPMVGNMPKADLVAELEAQL